jgi:hypothetical protein
LYLHTEYFELHSLANNIVVERGVEQDGEDLRDAGYSQERGA